MTMKNEYIRHLLSSKGLSRHTATAASNDITAFASWIEERHNGTSWRTLTQDIVQEYVADMTESGKATATVKRRISSLRSYCRWMVSKGLLTNNPIRWVTTPKRRRTLPNTVEKAAIDTVVSWGGMTGAFVSAAYDTGMRLQEILDLDTKDMDFQQHTIRVRGKGGKERTVYFTQTTADYFKGVSGRPFASWTQVDARNAVARAFRPLGRRCTPHTLRHTFATEMVAHGCDLETLKRLLGHENIETTARYLNMPTAHLKEMYNKYHD